MEETIVFGTPLDLNLDLTTPLTPQKPDTRALQVQTDLLEGEIAALQNQKNMLNSSLDQRIGLGKFLLPENLYTTNNPLNFVFFTIIFLLVFYIYLNSNQSF